MGYTHYILKGYRVLVSIVSNTGYDFAIEKDAVFKRVNVKTAGLKSKRYSNSWSISQSGTNGAYKNEQLCCDIFLVYLPCSDKFIELDGDFFSGYSSKSKLIPKGLL